MILKDGKLIIRLKKIIAVKLQNIIVPYKNQEKILIITHSQKIEI